MFTGMLIVLAIGCLVLTVSMYEVLKKSPPPLVWIARLIELNPLIAFAFNFAVSFILAIFIGAGMVAGAANLTASIIFPFYVMARKRNSSGQISADKSAQGRREHSAFGSQAPPMERHSAGRTTPYTGSNNQYGKTKTEAAGEAVGKALKKGSVYGYKAGKAVVKGGSSFVRGFLKSVKKK